MNNRFNRSNFLKKNLIDGVNEFDLNSNSINDFEFTREMTYYKITQSDLLRPDLIAIKSYGNLGDMNLWWIIMYVNEIHDIWNDLYIGLMLQIPNKLDIEDFYTANRNRT